MSPPSCFNGRAFSAQTNKQHKKKKKKKKSVASRVLFVTNGQEGEKQNEKSYLHMTYLQVDVSCWVDGVRLQSPSCSLR